jgi:hypothetical protein
MVLHCSESAVRNLAKMEQHLRTCCHAHDECQGHDTTEHPDPKFMARE